MTREQLLENLEPFSEPTGMGATVYFILKSEDGSLIRLADIEADSQPELLKQYLDYIRREIIDDEEKSVISLSTADDRTNVIYHYDLDEVPQELNVIDEILEDDERAKFSFTEDNITNLQGFLILIGNNEHQLAIYKKHYPVSLFQRDSVLSFKVGNRLVKLDEDILRMNETFEFFKLNGELFILRLNTLERFFGFHEVIKRKATEGMTAIRDANILDNPEELEELIEDVSYARKLTKVTMESPVLGRVPNEEVIQFTKVHPKLRNRFKYNQAETQIHLHTKKAKNLFLKLLNDDYLHSELTERYYEALAKDSGTVGDEG